MGGKALYPAVTFRSMTLHMNLGEEAIEELPFVCRMIGAADQADVEVAPRPEKPKDGKYEVLCPVGLPEEGLFEWLDMFLKKNKRYTEVSDRAMQTWCEKSGIINKGKTAQSKDKPDGELTKITTMLRGFLPLQQRDVILMELKANLLKESRANTLLLFPASMFKRIAIVAVGEPTADFRKHTLALIRQDKQEESDKKFKIAFQQEKMKWMAEKKKKELEVQKKKAEKSREKAIAAQKKKVAEMLAKKEAEKKAKESGGNVEDFLPKPEEKAEEPEEDEVVEVEMEEPEPVMGEPPKYQVTDEDKRIKFRTTSTRDLAEQVFNTSFQSFSVPSKDEGFDAIRYEWGKEAECEAYVKEYVLAKKQTTRVENIAPSQFFFTRKAQWEKAYKEYQGKLTAWKAALAKKEADKKKKEHDKFR